MRWRRAVRNLLVPRGRERDESGAVAVMVGLLTVVLVGVCSLAIDIGYQRVAKRDMQAIADIVRSEEHTSELQSLMRISYAVFCLKKKTTNTNFQSLIPITTNNELTHPGHTTA